MLDKEIIAVYLFILRISGNRNTKMECLMFHKEIIAV
jgi:hypothetical protein